jgi:hypothetical protein
VSGAPTFLISPKSIHPRDGYCPPLRGFSMV